LIINLHSKVVLTYVHTFFHNDYRPTQIEERQKKAIYKHTHIKVITNQPTIEINLYLNEHKTNKQINKEYNITFLTKSIAAYSADFLCGCGEIATILLLRGAATDGV